MCMNCLAYGFYVIYYDPLSYTMTPYDFILVHLAPYGSLMVPMTLCGSLLLRIVPNGFLWLPIRYFGPLSIHIDLFSCPPMALHCSLWLNKAFYGFLLCTMAPNDLM